MIENSGIKLAAALDLGLELGSKSAATKDAVIVGNPMKMFAKSAASPTKRIREVVGLSGIAGL